MLNHPLWVTLLLFIVPGIFIFLLKGRKIAAVLSPVVACFGTGMILGNLGIVQVRNQVFEPLSTATVLLAIPLLLMTTDFRKWMSQVRPVMKAMLASVIGVMIGIIITYLWVGKGLEETPYVLGMISACLVGTNTNMSAVGIALKTDSEVFTLTTSSDLIVGGIFFLYLVSIAPWIYRKVLRKEEIVEPFEEPFEPEEIMHHPSGIWSRLKEIVLSLVTAVLLAGMSVGLTWLVSGRLREDLILVFLSLSGIAAGAGSSAIRSLKISDGVGQYLLLVFCLAIGMRADINALLTKSSSVFMIVTASYFLSGFFQLVMYKIFRISADTAIMASAGTIFGPVFIGQVAYALRNKAVLLSGMVIAIAGYAVGNFIGLSCYRFFAWWNTLLQ